MTRSLTLPRVVATLVFAFALASTAEAQVRWDVELAEGVSRRVLVSRPAGASDAGPGPTLDAGFHLALYPLVRVGVYAHQDASPLSGTGGGSRAFYGGGVDARLLVPWLRGDVRAYVRVGLGELAVLSTASTLAGRGVPGRSGHLTEVPLAFGLFLRVERAVAVILEAGARFGFASGGGAYAGRGDDAVAPFVQAGVMWGR